MAGTPIRIVTGVVAVIAAAGLALLAVRSAGGSALPPGAPVRATLLPSDPDGTLTLSLAATALGRGRFDDAGWRQIAAAASRLPLDARPFFIGAVRALAAGRERTAIAMLEEARRRDPRLRLSRLLLMDRYLRAGRIADASAEMSALARLLPDAARGPLTDALAGLARDPTTSVAARSALLRDPSLFNNVLTSMAVQGADPGNILRFAGRDAPRTTDAGNWRAALVSARIKAGDPVTARRLWGDFYRPTERGPIVDGDFRGTPAPPPFGWDTTPVEGVGVASILRGALDVQYYGRQSGTLARQLLLLAPGAYRLQVRIEGTEAGDGAALGWTLTCDKATAPFATMAPLRIEPAPHTLEMKVTVPASGCAAQWLALEGIAGEFAAAINARVDAVRIVGAKS